MSSQNLAVRFLAVVLVTALAAGLAGCTTPTATVVPTVDTQPTLIAVRTEAAKTVIADATKNAPPTATPVTPTSTPAATSTPLPTATLAVTNTPVPSPTATFIPWTLTPTLAPYNCVVTESSPALNANYTAGANFDAKWVVKNTGTQTWLAKETDLRYSTGTKMQKTVDGLDMTTNVAPNESYTFLVDMVAPATAGTYEASWIVITGKNTICTLRVKIVVP
jgi:hypothetical protein